MLKKYGKAIEQPQAHCLSIFTVSRRMGSPESERAGGGRAGGKSPVLSWASLASLLGAAASQHPQPFLFPLGSHPSHPRSVGCWERLSHWNGGSSEQKVTGTGDPATRPGTVSCVCAWRPRLWMLGGPGEAAVPTPHFLRPRHLHASQQSWPHVPKKAMIQDREAEPTGCVIQKRGYRQRDFRNKFNFGFPTFSDHKN